jgi:asparagine synthase (glutamine-hydrolysing)
LADQLTDHFRWMRPETRERLVERVLEDETRDHISAARQLGRGAYRFRYLHRARADLGRVAADRGVAVAHPLLDAGFVAGLAERVGFVGLPSRTAMMQRFFGGLLPGDVLARTTKARFDDIFWTADTTRVAGALPLDRVAEFIDIPALLDLWASDRPKGNTFLLAKYLMALSRVTERPVG